MNGDVMQDFEIARVPGSTYSLYTPQIGDTYCGNFVTVQEAAREAVRLGGSNLSTIVVIEETR